MKPFVTLLVSLLALHPAFAAQTRGADARIALRTGAEVSGATILLRDLIPEDAPDYVREESARIPLGVAPRLGSTRVLSMANITSAIERAGLSGNVFRVPERVIVHRAGRIPTEQDVWSAVQRYLAAHPASAIRDIQINDLKVSNGFSIAPGSRIEVARVTFDRALQLAQIHLKVEGAAESANPVYASVRFFSLPPIESLRVGIGYKGVRVNRKESTSAPILVEPKTIARLHLHSSDSDMLLEVRPLERGALDQTIRVRMARSAKTLQARVVGENALDATF